ncbi:MAG: AAA family ATPase [Verrucomicrobia bacterium]|nr:AAA family ATPase [Verrucomicrobiota bacterium]
MGIAKEKLFGRPSKRWPKLQRLVEQGVLLTIDLAYAATQTDSEEEAVTHAALLSLARQGHLRLSKELFTDPILTKFARDGAALPKSEYIEDQIVAQIKRLLLSSPAPKTAPLLSHLTTEQSDALQNVLSHPLSIITGGPGTGKTFTAAQIVKGLQATTILTAPTGKAASHLESQIDHPVRSGTLHSLLEVRGPLDYAKEVTPLDAELIIVDECSMIDPPLFARLLTAIGPDTRLVLMGDRNQLPAVEGGSIFADLIESNQIPTAELTKCMRSDRNEILNLAKAILDGTAEEIRTIDLGFADKDIESIYQRLWNHVKDRDFNRFRILSTLRKGPLGVDALNTYLFEKFSKITTQFPIMIRRNDSRTGLSNGDTGILKGQTATFSAGQQFSIHELPPFEYAYCISVHKSQGSEYEQVLFLVPDGSEAFGKEVLYTAVTRAKLKLEIDGNAEQIRAALSRSSGKISGICQKLTR